MPPDARAVIPGDGTFSVAIVGESHYQPAITAVCGPRTEEGVDDLEVEACLVLEDGNPYDSEAVRVDIRGRTVGYLSRAGARHYRKALAKLGVRPVTAYCQARIRGGWDRGEDDQGFYGVYLDIPKV